MVKNVYYAAFVDKFYGDPYMIHSSTDRKKLIRKMMLLHKNMKYKSDVIVLSRSRIYAGSGFHGFWSSKAGTTSFIGHIEMDDSVPIFYSKTGKKARVFPDGTIPI